MERQGLSFQAHDNYPLRTTVDQRGEQTKHCDAKTVGDIKSFSVILESSRKSQKIREPYKICVDFAMESALKNQLGHHK